jgi:formylglycine-generating enzyme required for sulfatase activity
LTVTQKRSWLAAGFGLTFALATFLAWKYLVHRTNEEQPEPGAGLRRASNSLGMKFIELPAGTFLMGSPPRKAGDPADHRPDGDEQQHEVEITRPFFLGIHEVTQEQFARVMGENPSVFTSAAKIGGPDHPVENVSWAKAVEFCEKLSALPEEKKARRRYRLPTEAEWEYACRAGKNETPFSTGNDLHLSDANILRPKERLADPESHAEPTKPVGSYPPNAWGLYDMHGNVWEWCSDWYDPDYYRTSPQKDPTGPATGEKHVARGGSRADYARECRSANRLAVAPKVVLGMGLRVVLIEGGD